ncbi:MAG: hypothetical protein ACTSWN_05345 [Promethearchaeota archaeon]
MKNIYLSFDKDKIVFIDWLYFKAGYGNRPNSKLPRYMPYGVSLENFKPKISLKPVLEADRPWERDFIGSYISIVQESDKIRMWYEAFPSYELDRSTYLCYAESDDGFHWIKTELNVVEWNGSTKNNIVFRPEMHPTKRYGLHGISVFIDRNPACPESERYKLAHSAQDRRYEGYCFGAVSPDGIHWTVIKKPIAKTWADSQTIIRWHPEKKKYIGFFRMWQHDRRQVYYGEAEDFRNFKDLRPILVSDPTFPPDHDFYTNGFHFWPGAKDAYILMPTVYRRTLDDLQVEMRGSRDLCNWFRFKNNPIISPEDNGFKGGQYLGTGIIDLGDGKWHIPLGVPEVYHNEERRPGTRIGKVYLATWREDGFTGIVAREKGEIWTQPFYFSGSKLKINGWTHPGGLIRVGLVDSLTNRYLPGKSLDDCDGISGDSSTWKTITWADQDDLTEFNDVHVIIHFELTRATIHAFRFSD